MSDAYSIVPGDIPGDQPPVNLPNIDVAPTRPRITVGLFEAPKDWERGLRDEPPSPTPQSTIGAAPSVDWEQGLRDEPPPPPQPPPYVPPGGGLAEGAASGTSFGLAPTISGVRAAGMSTLPQEVQDVYTKHGAEPVLGALVAGLGRLGYEHLIAPALGIKAEQYGTEAFRKARTQAEREREAAAAQRPGEYLTGQVGGAIATAPVLGGSAALNAPTTAGRIIAGARTGAIGGGAYGAGESVSRGEDLGTVLEEAGKGVATGGAFGTLGSTGAEAIGRGGRTISGIVRGQRDTEAEAARRVVDAMRADVERAGLPLTAEEQAVAARAGVPGVIADVGDERTRALARSAANTSPEARAALVEATQRRFEQQGRRIGGFIRRVTGGGDAYTDREAIAQAARAANAPAYARAYAKGGYPLKSDALDDLATAPAVQEAMNAARSQWKNWRVNDGFGAPDFTVPNLQFWDYAARHLAGKAQAARTAGQKTDAGMYGGLEQKLKAALDDIVPEYNAARRGAAGFFGADNALEAGQNFVMSNASLPQAAAALGKMNQAERELFARGFASDLADKIEKTGYNLNALNSIFLNNGPARQKIYMALGDDRARQVEALLRVEAVRDRLRQALGNSTTFRQAVEGGLAGAGAVAAFEGLKEHDFNPSHVLAAALTVGAARHGAKVVDEKVARRVGELLASDNPAVLERGIQIVSKSPTYINALRNITSAGARVGAHDIGPMSALAGAGVVLDRIIQGPPEPEAHQQHNDPIYESLPAQ